MEEGSTAGMATTSDAGGLRKRGLARFVVPALVAIVLAVVAYGLVLWVKAGDPTAEAAGSASRGAAASRGDPGGPRREHHRHR